MDTEHKDYLMTQANNLDRQHIAIESFNITM